MRTHHLRRTPLIAACTVVAALLAVPVANAASVPPTFYEDNPSCAELGMTTIFKFEGSDLQDGTQNGVTLANVDTEAGTFDWSSTVAVDAVIAKGGPDANVYFYPSDTFGDTNLVTPDNNGKPFGLSHVEFCTDGDEEPPEPGIDLEKTALVDEAPAGSPVEYEFAVTNTGNVSFAQADVVLTDTKCDEAPVPIDADGTLDPGETWTYTCVATIPDDAEGTFVNVAEVCVPNPGEDELCDDDTTTVRIPPPGQEPEPGIDLEKVASVASAAAGTPVTYTFTVKNTGGTTILAADVVLTDAKCNAGTLKRTVGDAALSPEETWTYTCVATIPAGTTGSFVNTAEVCIPNPGATPPELCDTDTTTVTIPPPTPPVNPPVNPPGGGELPGEVVSGRAALRGPSGCVKQAFRARVTGRNIASVTFFLDGKRVKRVSGERSVYSVKIRPNSLRFGRHRVVARVQFTAESETASRRLPLTFRRCGRGAVAPRFTG